MGGLRAGAAGAAATSGSSPPVRRKRYNWCGLLGTSSLKEGARMRGDYIINFNLTYDLSTICLELLRFPVIENSSIERAELL
jgi:hypothetical protein